MKKITTVCTRDCYDACSLIFTLDESGQIVSVKGDPNHPFTQGFTCPRGAKDHERLSKNRVETPFVRQENNLEQTGWKNALDFAAQKLHEVLEQYGPEAVLYLDYAGNTGVLSESYPQRLWNAIGATRTDHAICSQSGHTGLALHYGTSYGIAPEELSAMKLIVFWGFNAAVSSPHLWALARKARKQHGTKIIVIDPIQSKTAKLSDMWIQPTPGSDVALAYGIMNYLIRHHYVDLNFILEATAGFDQLKEETAQWPLEKVEQLTGVTAKRLERLGEAYHMLKPNTTMIGIGLQKCARGADQVRAVACIPALLGLHRGFFYSNNKTYSIDPDLISGESLTLKQSKIVPQVAVVDLIKQGNFKFIYINGMNPAMTLANANAFREGLVRKDVFAVVHETHWTRTTDYADVILPAPTYLEKDDLVIAWTHNLARYSPAIIQPITDSRRETAVMQELARRLNLKEEWLYADPWKAIEPTFENAFEDGDIESLKSGATLKLNKKPKNFYPTPSGKIELYSSQAEKMGWNPLPQQIPLHKNKEHFIFITSATSKYTHTQFQEVYGKIPAIVLIHSEDAQQHGIEDGDRVLLSNERGNVQAKAELSDAVAKGVVWSPRQFEGLEGAPQNCLMSSKPQEIGSGPRFNSTIVTISKI